MNEYKKVRLGDVCEKGSSNIAQNEILENEGNYPIYGAAGFIKNVDFYKQEEPYIGIVKDGADVGRVSVHPAKSSLIGTMQYIFPKENIEIGYLAAYLKSQNLGSLYKGAAIPHIYFKDYENFQIPLPPKETQKQIASSLDKVTKIITENKTLLEKYDLLIKSRFIEMFGNPQCISNNWKVNPLSDYCIVNPKKSELGPIPDDYELSFIPMQSVSENGDVDTSSIKHYKDVKTGFTYFRENDVLFAKITPCMENGKGGVARKLKNQIGFGSTEFLVLRPIETISNSEWIYRLTTFKTFRKDAENNMTGSAGQRRTPKEFFDKYKVGLPPIELQNDFASFVQQIDKSKFENNYKELVA